MELRRYLGILRRRLWLVLILLVVGGIVGDIATTQVPAYAAQSTIYIGPSNYLPSSATDASGIIQQQLVTGLVPTYAKLLASQPIAAAAISSTGLPLTPSELLANTTVSVDLNTTLLRLTVVSGSAVDSQELANAMADSFAAKVKTLAPSPGTGTLPAAPAYVYERATLPAAPLPSKLKGNVIRGGLAGIVVGIGLAGLLEYLDVTIKGPTDAERRLELAVLGVIPYRRENA